MKMKRILCRLNDIVFSGYAVLIGFILVLMAVTDVSEQYSMCQNASVIPNYVLIALTGVCILACSMIKAERIANKKEKKEIQSRNEVYKIILIGTVLLYAIQLFIAANIFFLTDWDVGVIRELSDLVLADAFPEYGWQHEYLIMYPNNRLLFIMTVVIKYIAFRLHIDPNFFLSCIVMMMIASSVGITSALMYRMTKDRTAALWAWIIAALSFGLSPWMIIPYSDAVALFFMILSLYMYVACKDTVIPIANILQDLLILLPAYIGYLIKPQCAIFVIALFASWILECKKITLKRTASLCLAGVLCLGISACVDATMNEMVGLESNKDAEFPMTHFIMMGLNEENTGKYNQNDVNYTLSFANIEEKKSANHAMIQQRVRNFGIEGLIKHLSQKLMVNYNDGTFAWGGEGRFYLTYYDKPFGAVSDALRSLYDTRGSRYGMFATVEQALWILMLLGSMIAAVLVRGATEKGTETIIILSIIGITLFTLIFEARARYLFLYVPYYVLAGVLGIFRLPNFFRNSVYHKNAKKE